jgi:hypothetical protein
MRRAGALLALASALAGCGNGDDTASSPPVLPDAGVADATKNAGDACVPDSTAQCNACATPAADPYNACSRFAPGCVRFDAARVPAHPTF